MITIEGQKVKLNHKQDLNNDGIIDDIEQIDYNPNNNETHIVEPTELGESLKELNDDTLDKHSRMSGIDMRSRLHYTEISSILGVDTLVMFRLLPVSCLSFTRQKKRLAVSLSGKGREDIVNIVGGKREHEERAGSGGFMDKMKGFVGGQK